MKKLILSALVIAAMTSCSKNEVTEKAQETPIKFTTQFSNSVSSKAASDLDQSIKLGVYAYYESVVFNKISDMGLAYKVDGWYLDNKNQYYPSSDKEVSFWAYGPKDTYTSSMTELGCDAVTGPKFTLTLSSSDLNVDLYATQTAKTGKKTAPNPISFDLKRLMSQVKFKVKGNELSSTCDVKVESINIKANLSASYAASAWSAGSAQGTLNVLSTPTEKLTTTAIDAGGAINIIPGQLTTFEITYVAYITDTQIEIGRKTATYSLDGTTGKEFPEMGKSYVYTITVDPAVEQVIFGNPKLDQWEPSTSGEIIPQ